MGGMRPIYTARGALHVNVGQHTHTRALNLRFHFGHIQLWSERGTFIPTHTVPTSYDPPPDRMSGYPSVIAVSWRVAVW